MRKILRSLRQPGVIVPAALHISLVLAGAWNFDRQAKVRRAREVALPEIERLAAGLWVDFPAAYKLAERAEKIIPRDPKLAEMFSRCSLKMDIKTEPAGARVYYKESDLPRTNGPISA
ncbi:MAG: hypothetical protein HXY20_11295 [Acidobacteria bacterium]|nr:hypothetical protein [Acidobacteriota bacterium]